MISHVEHFCGRIMLDGPRESSSSARPDIYFRGYLVNQTELACQMGLDHSGGSVLDLISKCYERWGRALPARLDGQFALVIADRATGDILITRDALGVIPLYWELKADSVRFASRMRDLVDRDSCNDLNLKEIERYILFGGAVSDETCYSSIKRLEPGSSIWINNCKVSHDIYWDPRSLGRLSYKKSTEYIETFLELVNKSVSGSLLNSRSPWIALSGGLDSNTILRPGLKCCSDLQAYSIVAPQWPEENESQWIKRIVDKIGIHWTPINAEEILPFNDLPQEFCGSPDAVVLYRNLNATLSSLVGKDVLLTGDGGDSFMGAQMGPVPSHLADPIFWGERTGVVDQLLQWGRQSLPERSEAYWVVHSIILPSIRHVLRRNVRPPHYHLHPSWLHCGRPLISNSRALQPKAVAPHCQSPGQQAILDDLWQCAEDTTAVDKTYSNRHPLFNRSLFEFLWSIPWSQKQLPLCDRYLQRRALKGIVDDDIRTRIGYGIGTRCFIEGLRRSRAWQDYLCDGPAIAALGFVDVEKWRNAIQQACVGQTNAEPLLVRAITVEVWLKQLSERKTEFALSL